MQRLIAAAAVATIMAVSGCAGVRIYENGQEQKRAGIQIRMTEPWLAVMPTGETRTVEIPTGQIRELRPYNFMSRSSINLELRESGSVKSFGVSSDASGASDALRSVVSDARAMSRGFAQPGEEQDSIILTLVRLSDLSGESRTAPRRIVFWESGRIEHADH